MVRKPRKRHPPGLNFIAAVQEEIALSNVLREVETFKLGVRRWEKLSMARLAKALGGYDRIFYKIHQGEDQPTWALIKSVVNTIPSASGREFEVAQKLIEASARDTGKVPIEIDPKDPESLGRLKFLARDAALEMTSKEYPHV